MAQETFHTPVMTRARKRFGHEYPSQPTTHNAHIKPNESIHIWGTYSNREYDRTFVMGETVEYDSYNLSYMGNIVGIGANSVTVESYGRRHRMNLDTFCWRNCHFDADKASADNHETMMYI